MTPRPLAPKQARFVEEYLVDLNATQAAIRAGYSERTANEQGARLLANASVVDAIAHAMAARSERTQITQDQVLAHWWSLANADPNELIELRRTCCRHCHGADFGYQRTAGELARDQKAQGERFDAAGGGGFDARRPPHPDCPECFGEGVERPFPKDTRHLSAGARRLYAGVKVTKEGLEVKMHDQAAALLNVAKHLGMLAQKHEVTGKDGGPIDHRVAVRFVRPGAS